MISKIEESGYAIYDQQITTIVDDDAFKKFQGINHINIDQEIDKTIKVLERFRLKAKLMLTHSSIQMLIGNMMLIRSDNGLRSIDENMRIEKDYGWSKCVTGRVSVITYPGNHKSFLTNNSDKIANDIYDYL